MDPDRTYFGNHVWIEFQTEAGQMRVLDITHGRRMTPTDYVISIGQEGRWNYIANSTEAGFYTNTFNHRVSICKCEFVFLLRYFR